jgi:predicted adenine nucleotide alpha hydrolase (AANH) superfamily ATPase
MMVDPCFHPVKGEKPSGSLTEKMPENSIGLPMNYQKMMEDTIADIGRRGLTGTNAPALLLHSCCGPCSSAVIASLSSVFNITVFFYNPNIDEKDEYEKRAKEQERLIGAMPAVNRVRFIEGEYRPEDYHTAAQGRENDEEGGERLEKTAKAAHEGNYDFFATTLSISPMKDAGRINSIGSALGKKHKAEWLWADFKKKDGYKKSIELSRLYALYRQDYCGCSFSRRRGDTGLS